MYTISKNLVSLCRCHFSRYVYVGNSIAFDHEIPAVPKYAPFVAAGFFFGPASFLHEVKIVMSV